MAAGQYISRGTWINPNAMVKRRAPGPRLKSSSARWIWRGFLQSADPIGNSDGRSSRAALLAAPKAAFEALRIETWMTLPSSLVGCAQGSCRSLASGPIVACRSVSGGWRAHLGGDGPRSAPTLTVALLPLFEKVALVGSACTANAQCGSAATREPTCLQRSLFRRAGLRAHVHERSAPMSVPRSADPVNFRSLAEIDDVGTMYGSGTAILRLGRAEEPREQA
jgi:hypothetical protein